MFQAKTQKIAELSKDKQKVISDMERLLAGQVCMYIDYANVRPWSEKLKWHIDLKRLKQFLDSFSNIQKINFYSGILEHDERSQHEAKRIEKYGYHLRTKLVKIMKLSINTSGISRNSTTLLKQFIRKALLRKYDVATIQYLNDCFAKMNLRGRYYIEDRKCNFDVEIGMDMLLDAERDQADTFVLWSGDSDFHDTVQKLISSDKKVILFSTARKVAKELNELRSKGLVIFDIQKIRDFICRNRELISSSNDSTNAKKQKGFCRKQITPKQL